MSWLRDAWTIEVKVQLEPDAIAVAHRRRCNWLLLRKEILVIRGNLRRCDPEKSTCKIMFTLHTSETHNTNAAKNDAFGFYISSEPKYTSFATFPTLMI